MLAELPRNTMQNVMAALLTFVAFYYKLHRVLCRDPKVQQFWTRMSQKFFCNKNFLKVETIF